MTRSDLSAGAKAAQSCHALRQFVEEHKELDSKWFHSSNYLVLLEIKNEERLVELTSLAKMRGIKFSIFREPDFDNEVTAVAFEPGKRSKRLCGKLRLAYS